MSETLRAPLEDAESLADGKKRPYQAGAFEILLCRVLGELFAVENKCSHQEHLSQSTNPDIAAEFWLRDLAPDSCSRRVDTPTSEGALGHPAPFGRIARVHLRSCCDLWGSSQKPQSGQCTTLDTGDIRQSTSYANESALVRICPVHGAAFDVRDGSHKSPPAMCGIETFPVVMEDGVVAVEVPSHPKKPKVDPFAGPQLVRTR